MSSAYPEGLDDFSTDFTDDSDQGPNVHKDHHNKLGVAMEKVQAELGETPSGAFATVRARLDAITSTPILDLVTDYGADPNAGIDARAALDSALSDVPARGAIINLPGRFLIDSGGAIDPPDHVTFMGISYPRYFYGEPVSSSYLKIGPGFAGASLFAPGGSKKNIAWQNLGLFGGDIGTPGAGGKFCIRLPDLAAVTGEQSFNFNNVHIANWTGSGVAGRLHVAQFTNCHISDCGYWGIETATGTNNRWNDARFIGGYLYFNREGNVFFGGNGRTANVQFFGTRFERAGNQGGSPLSPLNPDAPGVLLENAANLRFIGCQTDANTGDGFLLRRTAIDTKKVQNIDLIGCDFGRDGGGGQAVLPDRASIRAIGFNASNRVDWLRVIGGKNTAGKADDGGAGIFSPKYGVMLDFVYDSVFDGYDAEEATFGGTVANRWNIGAGGAAQLWRTSIYDPYAGIMVLPAQSGAPSILALESSGRFAQFWYDTATSKIMVRHGGASKGVTLT